MKRAHPDSDGRTICLIQNTDGKVCPNTFSPTTGTSTLMMHLTEKHDISGKKSDLSGKRQKMIDGWICQDTDGYTQTEDFCITWATCGLAYSLVDNQRFRKTFRLSYPVNMNRKSLSENMVRLAEKFDRAVKDKIRGRPCTLCFDGWTNHSQKIVNLVITCDSCAYYLDSIPVEHNNENTLKSILDEGKQIIRDLGGILIAVSGDNFSGVVAAITKFCAENQQIFGFRCLAHSIQLTINDLSHISPLNNVFHSIIPNFVKHFNDPDNRKKLHDLQILSGKPENQCLRPTKPNVTRWSSTYLCICRIISLKNFLPLVGLVIPEGEWDLLYFSRTLLEQFKECTDLIQQDSSTVVDGVKMWKKLCDHLDDVRKKYSLEYDNFFKQAGDVIIRRTTKHMKMTPHMEVVNFLHPVCKTESEDLIHITDKLRSMGEYYFQELGLETSSITNKIDKLNAQMAAYILGGGLWELESEEETLVHYWTRQVFRVPELARVALFSCTPHPTEACVERTFSHQGLICNDLRGSLSEISVKSLMKVRFNYLALYKDEYNTDNDVEDIDSLHSL